MAAQIVESETALALSADPGDLVSGAAVAINLEEGVASGHAARATESAVRLEEAGHEALHAGGVGVVGGSEHLPKQALLRLNA